EVAVGILPVLVAGLDPGSEERLLRLVVLVPVVGHDRIAFDPQVADLALRHGVSLVVDDDRLVARHRFSRGAGPRVTRAVRGTAVQDLRRPDAIDELDAE